MAKKATVLEIPKPVEAGESNAKAQPPEPKPQPKPKKENELVDVLRERVEILTEQVKGFEKINERMRELELDLADFAVALHKVWGDPLGMRLREIANRSVGRK